MKTTFTTGAALFLLMGCALPAAADASISDVVARQRWPWQRYVDIDYVLTCDPSERMDIALTAKDGNATLTLPAESLTGDLFHVAPGPRRIVWDPLQTEYTNNLMLTQFSVTLTPYRVPLYMIVDLTLAKGADGQIEYVREDDLRAGIWGAWAENPVTNNGTVVSSVIWTGVATNEIYQTDKLVLRRIQAGDFNMNGTVQTAVTRGFYAGVFEVTQRQWEHVMKGTPPSWFSNVTHAAARPLENRSYDDIRGATNSVPAINWPATGLDVAPGSFLAVLREKTGITDFDLPTEAQWEYACRAGTTTVYHDGDPDAGISGANAISNVWMDVLGRYAWNGGLLDNGSEPARDCTPERGTAVCGSYRPNAWGLYDTHGNVYEWCLDWYAYALEGGNDPDGPDAPTDNKRITRGGRWSEAAQYCRPAYRYNNAYPNSRAKNIGFRLVRHLR